MEQKGSLALQGWIENSDLGSTMNRVQKVSQYEGLS